MYPVLAVMAVALAGCTVLVIRRRGSSASEETLGFAYVGAIGLVLLAVGVVVVGVLAPVPGRAEGLALLGLGAYVVYLLAAWAVVGFLRDRGPADGVGAAAHPPR